MFKNAFAIGGAYSTPRPSSCGRGLVASSFKTPPRSRPLVSHFDPSCLELWRNNSCSLRCDAPGHPCGPLVSWSDLNEVKSGCIEKRIKAVERHVVMYQVVDIWQRHLSSLVERHLNEANSSNKLVDVLSTHQTQPQLLGTVTFSHLSLSVSLCDCTD